MSVKLIASIIFILTFFHAQSRDTVLISRDAIEKLHPKYFKLHEFINFEDHGQAMEQDRKNILGCAPCTAILYLKNTDSMRLSFMLNVFYAKVLDFKLDGYTVLPMYLSTSANLFPVQLLPDKIHEIRFTYNESKTKNIYVYAERPRLYDEMLRKYFPLAFDLHSFFRYGFLGILLLACFTGIFQFIVRRDRFLIYYAGFAFFLGIYFLSHSMASYTFFYTSQSMLKVAQGLLPFFQAFYIVMYLLFAISISQKRNLRFPIRPLALKAIVWCALFITTYSITWLIDGKPIALLADIFRIGFIFICILIFINTWRNKDQLLNIVSFGALIFFSTNLIIYSLKLTGSVLNTNLGYTFILISGGFIEIIVFGIAIAYQTNEINAEKIRYLEALDQSNQLNKRMAEHREQELKEKVEQARKQIAEAEEEKMANLLRIQINELEMQALRSQINPHFLFNSLNSLKMFVHTHDKEAALQYIDQFAGLLRRLLENTFEKRVSLSSELELMKWYVELENLRLEERIDLYTSIHPSLDPDFIQIPAMILQPFIENAIWHGLVPKPVLKKSIDIYIDPSGPELLQICIVDNGIGVNTSKANKPEQSLRKSMGIQITRQRLNLLNNKERNIQIEEIDDPTGHVSGTRVTIWLNL
jgi:sensor histidine kinase YesM